MMFVSFQSGLILRKHDAQFTDDQCNSIALLTHAVLHKPVEIAQWPGAAEWQLI